MQQLTASIYRRLASDSQIISALASYPDEPSTPGIFSSRVAPDNALMPYIHIRPPIADVPWHTFTTQGRDITQNIAIYDEAGGSEAVIEGIGERVRDLFDQRPLLDLDGWHCAIIDAVGPADAPEETNFTGRLVSIRVRIQKL